jgi:L-alanine-DL-glutamate epimerase-like enolase superfamily enzyme
VWLANQRALRNVGHEGIAALAVSAVDVAMWDLKARLLGVAVADLIGRFRDAVPIYGSGGFCSYSDEQLRAQMRGYVDAGIRRVKMKVGRDPDRDRHRCEVVRAAIGDDVELYVDANGAYSAGQARRVAERLLEWGVTWFEEPVSSDDLAGLGAVRFPGGPDVAAGEYGYDLPYFARMVPVVDCLQVDVTRCGGYT